MCVRARLCNSSWSGGSRARLIIVINYPPSKSSELKELDLWGMLISFSHHTSLSSCSGGTVTMTWLGKILSDLSRIPTHVLQGLSYTRVVLSPYVCLLSLFFSCTFFYTITSSFSIFHGSIILWGKLYFFVSFREIPSCNFFLCHLRYPASLSSQHFIFSICFFQVVHPFVCVCVCMCV